jgi:hypothetical protein
MLFRKKKLYYEEKKKKKNCFNYILYCDCQDTEMNGENRRHSISIN